MDALIGQHRFQCSAQAPAAAIARKGLKASGGQLSLRIAIGECEAANALRTERGENLRDAAAAVIADEIDLIDLQGIEKFLEASLRLQ